MKKCIVNLCCLCAVLPQLIAGDITLKITKTYLNLPVSQQTDRGRMIFTVDGKQERTFVIRLAANPEYWVFCDMTALRGKTITIRYDGDPTGMSKIYQADTIEGQKNLYGEVNRPQFHFTARRGWNNDPNGLLFCDGEYHLFFQHNPYEREWENMHWGHAVSRDLIHWKELPVALYPDHLGTMFSGSTVMDNHNTSGFGNGKTAPMVAIYTAASPDKQTQCLAYSLDKGRSWTKYDKNPVIDSKAKWNSPDTRDPKVFWYQPRQHWVMVLNERDGHSIYTSANLREWKYESHTTGFWECPELFELPVDGNPAHTKWVMYGASGTYMIGRFDGKRFTPEHGKYYCTTGAIYAAQTYTGIPEHDGRRIQIGWGRIQHPSMPFNGMMLLPTVLTLKTTKDGVRLFNTPLKEIDTLQEHGRKWTALTARQANEHLAPFANSDYLRVRATIKLSHATGAGLNLNGQELVNYDMNYNLVNRVFYSPEDMTSMELSADIFIDKTSIEVFIDGGAYSYSMERKAREGNTEGLRFWGNSIEVKNLEVYPMKSIWK
jgi:fructan beta-fructosidase